ncbi:MAG: CPBP family glutamic-type intramembrane protease, partial [Planctomycetales bacterium]
DPDQEKERINTSLWSKILPVVLMIWAVTGAFYPAVDLCAGEKERGTLETLLTSPARRIEIVLGKLFTIMLFSIATALLNLVSMGITGAVVVSQLGEMSIKADVGPPPLLSMVWLSLMLIPVAALFSAICLALAAFARSTKEGQYYLMPVIMVTMPLILLPMAPNLELNFLLSLIPISGIVLLMRSIMEGTINELWPFAIPVTIVTFLCCWASVRWAVNQFRSEEVLFREGERWDVSILVKRMFYERKATPTFAMALMCGILILIGRFFVSWIVAPPSSILALNNMSYGNFAFRAIVAPMLLILVVGLAMAFIFTRNPVRTLGLQRPHWLAIPAAVLLAVVLVPIHLTYQFMIRMVWEPSAAELKIHTAFSDKLASAPSAGVLLLLLAVLPAVCEELSYRGFILSGFRSSAGKWRSILLTSFFFGIAHMIVLQQLTAFCVGILIGYIAVQCGSIWPCMAFHFTWNASNYFAVSTKGLLDDIVESDWLAGLVLMIGTLSGVMIIFWFHRHRQSHEEIAEALKPQFPHPVPL